MNEKDRQKGLLALKICKIVLDYTDNKGLLEKKIIRDLTLLERVSKFGVDCTEVIFAYKAYALTRDRMEQLGMDVKSYDAYIRLILSEEKENSHIQN